MNSDIHRIEYASADYYMDLRFRTKSDDVFAVKISATVDWGWWDGYEWLNIDEAPVSLVISIANYWQ